MSSARKRPNLRERAERQESTGSSKSYNHASRGFAHWLEVAPPTTSFAEVAKAYQEHDDPHDVWDAGQNHRLTDFQGGSE